MNLIKALATVSSMTLLSRILGFLRDAVIARVFGAGLLTDAFFVAFKIPNLLRRLFAEGALSQAFVPVLAEYRNQRGEDETRRLVDHVTGVLSLALLAVTVIGVVAAPVIIHISAPGFARDDEKFALTVELLRIVFPYIFFIALTALAGGVLNTWRRFAVPAFTPVLLNLCFIGFALFAAPLFDPPVKALAWAVFAGGVLQLAWQLPFLLRIRMLPRPCFSLQHDGVRRVLRQMGPALFGVSVAQISLLINNIFASFLVTGSVTWLYFADRLMEFPAGMLGVALGTVLLPSLSKEHATRSAEAYSGLIDWGLRLVLLLAVPAAAALALLSVPLITTLFHYGAFTSGDVLQTRSAVLAYATGLVGLIAVKVLAPGFYAQQDIRTPVRFAVIALVFTQLMNLALVWQLKHAGLALAVSLGACLNAILLLRALCARGIYRPAAGWPRFLVKLLFAVVVMMAFLVWLSPPVNWWLSATAWQRVGWLVVLVSGGGAIYFAALWASGFRLQDFSRQS